MSQSSLARARSAGRAFIGPWRLKEAAPDDRRGRLLDILSAALLLWLIIRIAIVVGASPIVANSNNYDFVRQSACVGVWLRYTDGRPKEASSLLPVDAVVFDGDRRDRVCLFSTDNAFPWAVAQLHPLNSAFPLHQIGRLKGVVAIALVLAIVLQPMAANCRLAIAAAGALMFGDFAQLLYFNTLYLEASTLAFGFASLILSWLIFARQKRPGIAYALCLSASLVWFAFARQQYAFFAVALAVLAAAGMMMRWRAPLQAAILGLTALGSVFGLGYLDANKNEHTLNIARANITDTVLAAVLPAASDQTKAIKILGLPPHCSRAIGMAWYAPAIQTDAPCPEVYSLSRLRLIRLFLRDPATFWTPLWQAVTNSRPVAGMLFNAHFERPLDAFQLRFQLISATSLSTLLNALPADVYAGVIVLSLLAGAAGLVGFLYLLRRRPTADADAAAAALLAGIGGSFVFYSLFSSVFGDGLAGLARHAIGLEMGIALQVGAALFWISRPGITLSGPRASGEVGLPKRLN